MNSDRQSASEPFLRMLKENVAEYQNISLPQLHRLHRQPTAHKLISR